MQKSHGPNTSTYLCEISRYLKSFIDDSLIVYDEIISIVDIVSINVTNVVSTNVTSTTSINSDNKR